MNAHHSEKGQVLVLIILAAVALFGFAALAVDMGQIFNARRAAQSAADAAALSAANTGIDDGDVVAAGLASALLNGFNNDGLTNTVVVNHPPTGGTPYDGNDEYYQVTIWTHVPPVFGHFFFLGDEETTVTAIARVIPYSATSSGNAIHALSKDKKALKISGNTNVTVDGGNIFSNGGGEKDGGSGYVHVNDGGILISLDGEWKCSGCSGNVVPDGQNAYDDGTDIEAQYPREIPQPYCPTRNETHNGVNYYYYPTGIDLNKDDHLVLQPGIHCIRGGIDLKAGKDNLTGSGVLLVLLDGGIKGTGSSDDLSMNLQRGHNIIDKNGNQYGGLLLWASKDNHAEIQLGGGFNAAWSGTVFAPGSECELGGHPGGVAQRSSVICDTVFIHGNPEFKLDYKQPENYQFAPSMELVQ